jgi:hypothetical protein
MTASHYNQRFKKQKLLIFDDVYSRWRKNSSIIPRPGYFQKLYTIGGDTVP